MKIVNQLRTAFSLVSRFRLSRREFRPDYSGVGFFLPFVGVAVGVLLFGLYYGGSRILPDPFITVLIVIGFQYFLFNLFHFDGLLDTADALSCYAGREKRLAILKDVHVGAFALFAGAVYIAAKLYLITKSAVYFHIFDLPPLSKIAVIYLFFSYPASGRGAAALVPVFLRPARKEGLGALLAEYPAAPAFLGVFVSHCVTGLLIVLAFVFSAGIPLVLLISLAGCLLALLITYGLYSRKVGGFTGDTLGFAVELGELLHILIFYLLLLYPGITGG
jgi:adenosylcobinamide-GDP ribazoletransferase